MALNVTTAVFGENCNTATASPSLAQWDKGQVLQISGVDLPDAYQVEFSTVYTRNAIPVIGNASGVQVPNELLQRSAPITACVVLHSTANSRDTEYWVTIHITPRKPPETITPDPEQQDVIDQAIAALQDGTARAEAAATAAAGSATEADGNAENAEAWAVGQRAGEDVPDTDPTYRNNAKYYAGAAEAAAEEAGQHEASWESWVRRAEAAADDAEGSARAAAGSKADATAAAQTATQKATEAGNSAGAAAGSASEARQTVDGSIGAINTAKEGALTAIGSAGSNAVGAVNQAGTTQTERVTTEGNTQVNRVQEKGDEVIGSIPQDYTNLVDDVADLSRKLSDVEENQIPELKSAIDYGATIPVTYVEYAWNGQENPWIFHYESGYYTALFNGEKGKTYHITVTGNHSRFGVFETTACIDMENLIDSVSCSKADVINRDLNEYTLTCDHSVTVLVYIGSYDGSVIVEEKNSELKITVDKLSNEIGVEIVTSFEAIRGYIAANGTVNTTSAQEDRTKPISVSVGDLVSCVAAQYGDTSVIAFSSDGTTWESIINGAGIDYPNTKYEWEVTSDGYVSISYSNIFRFEMEIRKVTNQDGIIPKLERLGTDSIKIGAPAIYFSDSTSDVEESLDSKTADELYAIYDDLCTRFPNVISRETDLATDESGAGIRLYTIGIKDPRTYLGEVTLSGTIGENINPTNYYNANSGNKWLLVNSGTHGDEKVAPWGTALAIKDIVESDSDWAIYLKSNFLIKVIPCLNPYGFTNNHRTNYNDVNINRDFGTYATAGATCLHNFVVENKKKIVFCVDVHNTSGFYAYYEVVRDSKYFDIYERGAVKFANSIQNNWLNYLGINKYPFMYCDISTFNDLSINMVEENNIPCITSETQKDFYHDVGFYASGNDLRCCKLTKDQLVNSLIMFGTCFM